MYSDNRKWDNVRSYYQPHLNNPQYGQYDPESHQQYGGRKRSSASTSNGHNEQRAIKEAITAIVQRSGVLGVKNEKRDCDEGPASAAEIKEQTRPSSSSSSVAVLENHQQQERFRLLEADPANTLLPTFDHLSNFPPAIQCRKFFEDIQPLDRILARIVRIGVAVIHVELVCTLTRFRRNLLVFMKGKLIAVAFDRTKRFYQVNDFVSTTVMAISPHTSELELQLDEDEAIFTHQGIPAYSRDIGPTTFDESKHISHLRDNPNLALQLGVRINTQHSALPSLVGKHLHLAPSAERMRQEQTAKLAITHVVKGAELTRENKCFEAIQCFNKALAVDANCPDAYVGRGAACAGMRNFTAALLDFDKAIQLQPTHKNANKYRVEVLMAYGKEQEKLGDLKVAREQFERLLELQPGHQQALEAIKRIRQGERAQQHELIDLSDGEGEEDGRNMRNGTGRKSDPPMTEEEALRNREKLEEMEAFIRKLKNGGK